MYNSAVLKKQVKADYLAVPNAIFTYPEIAMVGMGDSEATAKLGEDRILIGFYRYEDTAKGEAINAKGYFVKVIVEREPPHPGGAHDRPERINP